MALPLSLISVMTVEVLTGRMYVCMCICVCVGVLEIHWQKTNTHMQIGSALKTNVLCIDIALFLTLPLPSSHSPLALHNACS